MRSSNKVEWRKNNNKNEHKCNIMTICVHSNTKQDLAWPILKVNMNVINFVGQLALITFQPFHSLIEIQSVRLIWINITFKVF